MMVYRNGNDKSKYQKKKISVYCYQTEKEMSSNGWEVLWKHEVYCASALNQLHNMQKSR